MFDVNNKQYILNLSTGRKAYFYYTKGLGIFLRWQSEDGKWQEPILAVKNGLEGFSACLDKDNGIHVLYQDSGDNIIYMKYSEGTWNRKAVLRSKNQDAGNNQLHIACCKNGVYAFYIFNYIGKKYLNFQDLKYSDSPVRPITIDQVCDFPSYKVLFNNSGGMSIFYRALRDGKKVAGFKTYETGSSKWSSFQPFPSPNSDLPVLCAATGLSDTIHLCLQRNDGEKYCLIHCKYTPGSNNWENIVLAESQETFYNLEIYINEDCIRVFWANKTGITCRTSHDNGNSWDMEQKLDGFDDKHISCFSYIQNAGGNECDVRPSVIPGSFKDILKLAFLNTPSDKATVEDGEAESLRRTITELLKLLSGNINEIYNNIIDLYKRLDSYDAAQHKLELDINKYDIKEKLIENDMAKVISELDLLKTRIDEYDTVKTKSEANTTVSCCTSETSSKYSENIPLMPGNGFNTVTVEFLKGHKK